MSYKIENCQKHINLLTMSVCFDLVPERDKDYMYIDSDLSYPFNRIYLVPI